MSTLHTDSAHRSRRAERNHRRTMHLKAAEQCSFRAVFCTFAADVANQRCRPEDATAYREDAQFHRRKAVQQRLAAERCRPWWKRPRAALRDWGDGLFASWSWRTDDPGPKRQGPTRPGVEP